ncbi:hypothetical protein Tco_1184412 [Tanacetum coccineum]
MIGASDQTLGSLSTLGLLITGSGIDSCVSTLQLDSQELKSLLLASDSLGSVPLVDHYPLEEDIDPSIFGACYRVDVGRPIPTKLALYKLDDESLEESSEENDLK